MLINNIEIGKALEFYNIQDEEYKSKCYECIKYINQNIDLKENFNNIYEIMYSDNSDRIRELWGKEVDELFGENYPNYITNIMLLSGYKIHIENMKKFNLDEEQILIHKNRVKEELTKDIYEKGLGTIRISQMIWGAYFVTLRLIEVGRLQYEVSNVNPAEDKIEKCIKIHIPKGNKLDINEVKESIINSKKEIKRYFNIENVEYYCSSWLLSKEIKKLLEDNSSISQFSDLFDILKERNGIEDILEFVYNLERCEDYSLLQEKTTLQKRIKEVLLKNEDINIGIGILKQF